MPDEEIHLTASQLRALAPDAVHALLLRASKVTATAVVRRADGSIKYDDPALAGRYGEEHIHGDDE